MAVCSVPLVLPIIPSSSTRASSGPTSSRQRLSTSLTSTRGRLVQFRSLHRPSEWAVTRLGLPLESRGPDVILPPFSYAHHACFRARAHIGDDDTSASELSFDACRSSGTFFLSPSTRSITDHPTLPFPLFPLRPLRAPLSVTLCLCGSSTPPTHTPSLPLYSARAGRPDAEREAHDGPGTPQKGRSRQPLPSKSSVGSSQTISTRKVHAELTRVSCRPCTSCDSVVFPRSSSEGLECLGCE